MTEHYIMVMLPVFRVYSLLLKCAEYTYQTGHVKRWSTCGGLHLTRL